ncbi:MAG: ornithine carbamoyltransferase [Desulfosudaceae bacterium]
MKKDIMTLWDLNRSEMLDLFTLAADLKQREKEGVVETSLAGKVMGMLFDKHSTRTRVSFEAAMYKLGGSVIYMSPGDMQIARDEPVKDTARVLSGYIDALVIRTYSQALIEEYAAHASIPVINALSDRYHPCQVLSDLLTVREYKGDLAGLRIVWVGDGNNVANSWINAAAILGFELVLACPAGYQPDSEILDRARQRGSGKIVTIDSPAEAVRGANVIYTDVWASMGQEEEQEQRRRAFMPYQVNAELLAAAGRETLVMHCLPAHRGEEISEEVLEGAQAVVWAQAENKMHLHKALLRLLINPPARL